VQTRTRTRTVVFTDMADYSRQVNSADRAGLLKLLDMHQRFVEPVLTGRGGRIVKGIGDSFMAIFDSATDAVRACLDLVEAHGPNSGTGVAFRASLATGDVEESEDDAFGETVNVSSRINGKTPAGEVWFSPGTWYCMNQAEIPWESTGRHALKGIAGEIEVFRAVPQHAAHLPDSLGAAARHGRLVIWSAGDPVPLLPPQAHVVLEGFRASGSQLGAAVDSLPIVDPSHIWLCTYNMSPADRIEWVRLGRGLLIATPQALKHAAAALTAPAARPMGSDTIILDGAGSSVVNLVVGGLALPAVPFNDVVSGYSYDLLADGRWVNRSDRALLRVDVSTDGPMIQVLVPGVQVNGHNAPVHSVWPLVAGTELRSTAGTLRYVALQKEGYIGALVGDTQMRLGVSPGAQVELGREPNHPGLLLPDRNNQDNIRWCTGQRAARAREKGFTLDKSLTGRRQTGVLAEGSSLTVSPLHEACPTLLLSGDGSFHRLTAPRVARVGDLILMGTTVVALRDAAVT
jgi:class 3 adenylate cyclase